MEISAVVSYRNSTSNHNSAFVIILVTQLYLIEILHQTTTPPVANVNFSSCILSKFYIKPQRVNGPLGQQGVVSYRNSTSNHNNLPERWYRWPVVSYRNSTSNHNVSVDIPMEAGVVSYRNSTSNHNCTGCHSTPEALYLIEILHQTTTKARRNTTLSVLYLIEILHQTTTLAMSFRNTWGCILSKFYIKPQHPQRHFVILWVVSYRNSTSNHNQKCRD